MAHTHKHQVLYHIYSNEIGENSMSYNVSPKECNMHQNNNQPCVLSSNKQMNNIHKNTNPIRRKENMKTSSGSKKSHQYTHEYVYHHEITKDVYSKIILFNHISLHPSVGWSSSNIQWTRKEVRKIMCPSDSSEYHRCI